ncbi:MAG: regulatory protein RecX [Lachnospiraceae bacterium]|nr:regulatory protein RecX [Lachnospiraceae bacterium]
MERYITKLVPWEKKKVKVYIDDTFRFFLYSNEVKRLKIQQDAEVSEDMLNEIYKNILFPRCKNKLISLLEYKDRTSQELKERLLREGYPEEVVSQVISWAEEYHFIDIERFAVNYVKTNAGKKGNRLLRIELSKRGVEKELLDELLADVEENEKEQIEKIYEKRFYNVDLKEEKQRMKVVRYFIRNGFSYEEVQNFLTRERKN